MNTALFQRRSYRDPYNGPHMANHGGQRPSAHAPQAFVLPELFADYLAGRPLRVLARPLLLARVPVAPAWHFLRV